MKIMYVWHDCFIVRTPRAAVVFDFWKDPHQSGELPNPLATIPPSTPLYVLVSHGHKDHFNPDIFSWGKHFSNVHYVVSKDVRRRINHIVNPESPYKGPKVDPSRVTVLCPGERWETGCVAVEAFASTDTGNSYAVELDGRLLFHAGDLNAWLWADESTQEEIDKAKSDFMRILTGIKSRYPHLDACFFPVDARIGSGYFTGAKLMLDHIQIDNFFPMHFELAENPEEMKHYHRAAADFALYANPSCRHYLMLAPYSAIGI